MRPSTLSRNRYLEPDFFGRPTGVDSKLDSEAFKAIEAGVRRVYNEPTIPTMGTAESQTAS